MTVSPPERAPLRELRYHPPVEGEDYWIIDDVLPDPMKVRNRVLGTRSWQIGAPRRPEPWPGMRTQPCLLAKDLGRVEYLVRQATGASRLWVEKVEGGMLNHNCVQLVGAREGHVKPHTDSLNVCTYAGVIYLTPDAPRECGTAFYRQKMPDGHLGGNIVDPPHRNMVDAFGTRYVPADSFVEDLRIDNVFNRMVFYKACLIHSATAYCGERPEDRRMTNVFFWQAEH